MISLGNQNIGIGLAVRLHDHFSVKAAAITATMSAMHRNTQAVMMSNLRAVRGLALGFGIAGAVMTAGFAQTIKIAADFGWIMRGTQAVTQATDIQMKSMARSAIELSKGTVYAATEIGSAMEYLGRAGYTVPQINQTIEAVTMLGAATDAAIGGKGGVADMMTNMMTAFNMTAKASGRMSDILAYSTTRANIDVFDLHEALKFAGSSATQLKIPFEDVVAMVTVLGNAGIKAGIAGRSLGNVFQYMARAASTFRTKSQTDVLKILGIHPTQLRTIEGTLRPMGEIIRLFTKALKGVYDVEGTAGLQKLLNIRGARAFYPLTRAVSLGWDFNTMLKNIHTNSQGAATMMAKMRMDSLKGDMIILKDIWKAFKIEVGQTLEPFVRIVLKGLQKTMLAMTAFAKTPLGKVFFTLTSIIGITVGVAGLLLAGLISIRLITIGVGITGANMGRCGGSIC
jgi:TP901 family phage tail tape measure protein